MFLHSLRDLFIDNRALAAVLGLLFVTACDKGPNVSTICQAHPEICKTLQEDNWCRRERRETLVNFNTLQTTDHDDNKYKLLISLEQYAKCMDKASLIEHKKLKEKKNVRINNAIKAKSMIAKMSQETANSENPFLLYFHWSRHSNKASLAKFLALEGTKAVEDPESQYNLASYYVKRDRDKTLSLLLHALELYKIDDEINEDIFKSLTTLFIDQNKYKQAYIWLKVLALHSPDDNEFSQQTLTAYIQKFNLDENFLNKVAASTLANIEQGTFSPPKG